MAMATEPTAAGRTARRPPPRAPVRAVRRRAGRGGAGPAAPGRPPGRGRGRLLVGPVAVGVEEVARLVLGVAVALARGR